MTLCGSLSAGEIVHCAREVQVTLVPDRVCINNATMSIDFQRCELLFALFSSLFQVTIPNIDTTYWCAALEIPQEIQQQRQYIIRVRNTSFCTLINRQPKT